MSQENIILTSATPWKASQSPVERRSRLETYCDILRAIAAGARKPTHILYKANLSWTVLDKQIGDLETRGLVESGDDDGRKVYRLSDSGFRLLKQFLQIREELNLSPLEK
jgi:predicted transcriptional regulator